MIFLPPLSVPPANIARVELDAAPTVLATYDRSPKSVELPKVFVVTNSIILTSVSGEFPYT